MVGPAATSVGVMPFSVPGGDAKGMLTGSRCVMGPGAGPGVPVVTLVVFYVGFSPPSYFIGVCLLWSVVPRVFGGGMMAVVCVYLSGGAGYFVFVDPFLVWITLVSPVPSASSGSSVSTFGVS